MSQRGTIIRTSSNGDNVSQELLNSKNPQTLNSMKAMHPQTKATRHKSGVYIYIYIGMSQTITSVCNTKKLTALYKQRGE